MVIELECPWCGERMAIGRHDLDGEAGCEACGIRFVFATDVDAADAEVAVAA